MAEHSPIPEDQIQPASVDLTLEGVYGFAKQSFAVDQSMGYHGSYQQR